MAGKKILVIDDEPQIIHILEQMLSRYGYQVLTAGDGKAGLQQVKNEHPDLIILDLCMPELDGWRTCQRLKQATDTAQTPVIILSGLMTDVDDTTQQEMGDLYVAKPFEIENLIVQIRNLLHETQQDKQS